VYEKQPLSFLTAGQSTSPCKTELKHGTCDYTNTVSVLVGKSERKTLLDDFGIDGRIILK
jgi:hypothetical protein